MIPKIKFIYSEIYDNLFRENVSGIRKKIKYPSEETIREYIAEIEKIWNKQGKKILKELEKASDMKFKEKEIKCYVIGLGIPFSDPLTMEVYEDDKNFFIDMLTHELIHQLFIQNLKKFWDKMALLRKEHPNENFRTQMHIILNKIHKKVYGKFGWQKRMEKEIKIMQKAPDYKRAWELA
jgi:hypothetical protein